MTLLLDQINALKSRFEDWKRSLPVYYEPMSLPTRSLTIEPDEQADLSGYPYESRLEYVASMILLNTYLTASVCRTRNEFV